MPWYWALVELHCPSRGAALPRHPQQRKARPERARCPEDANNSAPLAKLHENQSVEPQNSRKMVGAHSWWKKCPANDKHTRTTQKPWDSHFYIAGHCMLQVIQTMKLLDSPHFQHLHAASCSRSTSFFKASRKRRHCSFSRSADTLRRACFTLGYQLQ